MAGCGEPKQSKSSPALQKIIEIYYESPGESPESEVASFDLPPYAHRLVEWRYKYDKLNQKYEGLRDAKVGDGDHFVDGTLIYLSRLTQLAISDIDKILISPPKVDSLEYQNFIARFEAINIAIGDRISVLEAKLGQEIRPK